MTKRNRVAAAAATLLLGSTLVGSPALAAGRQDGAQCRGNDAALAIASCSRIISDQDETAENRADAYLRRAQAYLNRGDIDPAIADDSEAIKLEPQNISAYVGGALAYFRKGDRDRAIIDFAIADRLDPKTADEIAAANPVVAQIAALARGSPSVSAGANAETKPNPFCPTRETARQGFALVDQKTRRKQQVDPSNGDVATNEYFVGGERALTATYYKGLLILFASFLESYINLYDVDFTRLGDYQVGQETLYHASNVTLDGKVRNVTVDRWVAARERLVIGECAFDTFVIESRTLFPDGTKTLARSNFSPTLRMSLRLIATTEGSQPYEISYSRIEPLSPPIASPR
jgi:tetratricopeptide (TPR) repeat protein